MKQNKRKCTRWRVVRTKKPLITNKIKNGQRDWLVNLKSNYDKQYEIVKLECGLKVKQVTHERLALQEKIESKIKEIKTLKSGINNLMSMKRELIEGEVQAAKNYERIRTEKEKELEEIKGDIVRTQKIIAERKEFKEAIERLINMVEERKKEEKKKTKWDAIKPLSWFKRLRIK